MTSNAAPSARRASRCTSQYGLERYQERSGTTTPAKVPADILDKLHNSFGDQGGFGTLPRWNSETELSLSPDTGPGLETGIGMALGASGMVTLEELRTKTSEQARAERYAGEYADEYLRARETAKGGTPTEDIEPVDITDHY